MTVFSLYRRGVLSFCHASLLDFLLAMRSARTLGELKSWFLIRQCGKNQGCDLALNSVKAKNVTSGHNVGGMTQLV